MNRNHVLVLLALLLSFSLSAVAHAEIVCRQGDTGQKVQIVQLRLKVLGYTEEEPASPYLFTAKTKAAVMVFQEAAVLPVTGIVDDLTYSRLTVSTAVTYETFADRCHVPGGDGSCVLTTRQRLKALKYLSGTQTTAYDSATERAVSNFQSRNNLAQTGIADGNTRAVLFSDNAISAATDKPEGNTVTLKLGSKGAEVSTLQTQLSDLGYFSDTISGVYAKSTKAAVTLFQVANGLSGTGIADEATRLILNAGTGKPFATYRAEQMLCKVSLGDTGYAVELLQTRLTELCYYKGAVNGSFSAAVQEALKRFQNCNNVDRSGTVYHGVATVNTRKAMNAASAIDRPTGEGLFPGDKLDQVTTMTQRLKALGYLKVVTNTYNAAVKTAVALFQKANSLTVSGKATVTTLEKLFSASAVTYDEFKNGSGNARIETLINTAYKCVGRPYSNDADPPRSFDCSRFTRYIFAKVGVNMSGEVESQAKQMGQKYGRITDMKQLKRGDLLYFNTQTDKNPGHAAIYLGVLQGKPQFIHASSAKGKVVVSVFDDWYIKRFEWGVRVWA